MVGFEWAASSLSQDDLAAEAEISRSYLSQIETGKYHVSLRIIAKLAAVLQAEPVEFFRRPSRRGRGG